MIDGPLLLQGLVLSSQDFSIQTCNLVLSDSINMVSPSLTCMVSPSLTWRELLNLVKLGTVKRHPWIVISITTVRAITLTMFNHFMILSLAVLNCKTQSTDSLPSVCIFVTLQSFQAVHLKLLFRRNPWEWESIPILAIIWTAGLNVFCPCHICIIVCPSKWISSAFSSPFWKGMQAVA